MADQLAAFLLGNKNCLPPFLVFTPDTGINIRIHNISPAIHSAKRERFGRWNCRHSAQRYDLHPGEIDSCLGPILVSFEQEHSYPTFRELQTISTFPVVMALFQLRLAFGYQPCTTRTRCLQYDPDNPPFEQQCRRLRNTFDSPRPLSITHELINPYLIVYLWPKLLSSEGCLHVCPCEFQCDPTITIPLRYPRRPCFCEFHKFLLAGLPNVQ